MNLTVDQAQAQNKHIFNERANVGLHAVLQGRSKGMRSGRQSHSKGWAAHPST